MNPRKHHCSAQISGDVLQPLLVHVAFLTHEMVPHTSEANITLAKLNGLIHALQQTEMSCPLFSVIQSIQLSKTVSTDIPCGRIKTKKGC